MSGSRYAHHKLTPIHWLEEPRRLVPGRRSPKVLGVAADASEEVKREYLPAPVSQPQERPCEPPRDVSRGNTKGQKRRPQKRR
jgi:hypothetical protein